MKVKYFDSILACKEKKDDTAPAPDKTGYSFVANIIMRVEESLRDQMADGILPGLQFFIALIMKHRKEKSVRLKL